MNKNFSFVPKVIFIICLFQMAVLSSLAEQKDAANPYQDKIKEYIRRVQEGDYLKSGREPIIKIIDQRVEFFMHSIPELKDSAVSPEKMDNKISSLIQKQFPVNWHDGKENTYNIIALCRIAKNVQSVTPLYQLSNYLNFLCIYSPGVRFFNPSREINYTLEDFPLMDLAVSLGEQSIPALSAIVLDTEKDFSLRLTAYFLCHQINEKTAKGLYTVIDEDLDERQRAKIEDIIHATNPIQAWQTSYSKHNLIEERSKSKERLKNR